MKTHFISLSHVITLQQAAYHAIIVIQNRENSSQKISRRAAGKHKARNSINTFNPDDLYNTAEMGEYESPSPPGPTTEPVAITRPRKLKRRVSQTPSGVTLVGSSSGEESDSNIKKQKRKRPFFSRPPSNESLQPPAERHIRRISSESNTSISSASPTFNESLTLGYPYSQNVGTSQDQSNIYSNAAGDNENSVYPYPDDADLQAFTNHIRSLIVSQSNSPDHSRSTSPTSPTFSNEGGSGAIQERPPTDERVMILNQTIRRMPTIESFGSRENSGNTTTGTGGARTGTGGSNSVAPTRTNTLASDGTGGASPQNSLRRGTGHSRPPSRLHDHEEVFNQEPILGGEMVKSPEAR